ncbi:MAG: DUF3237 domain-containing protein [Candidatus Rokuibacteriota bacterium]|nr:MAG: DUF3237 domain-containing protein [Candidatus Rokubacteria bacterium]PYO06099.1 MAG: DUF3237 domain-containing protein [Candidatus Rokubacteria bacterium]
MDTLRTEFLCEISADLETPQRIGATPHGTRLVVYVKGGAVEGPNLRGKVLPGGGDWLLVRPDGATEFDVRGTLESDDGHVFYVQHRGIMHAPPPILQRLQQGERDLDPSLYYFRITPTFETGSEKYAWLNHLVSVGVGRRTPTGLSYRIYAIL